MKTVGIITEYNPFHNGHTYQIEKIKELTHADFVVVAMSGDFVQRGAPAIIDKYERTRMAISCGADLVLELPALWATSSAENFAMAGVTLFDKMGCVDTLCFGAETDNLPLLSMIADILSKEPIAFSNLLSANLKKGLSFPTARALALKDYLQTQPDTSLLLKNESLDEILNSPNNILAIEYLKALKRRNSDIAPMLIKREGAGYHDASIEAPNASASAIRNLLLSDADSSFLDSLALAMPSNAFEIMKKCISHGSLLCPDDFSSILNYLLLARSTFASFACSAESADVNYYTCFSGSAGFANFGDSNEDISNRLTKNLHQFCSFTQFCELNKSRDITYTRMSRVLIHLILGITNEDYPRGKKLDYIPYLRLLGFKKDASALLSAIKANSDIPLISKLANASDYLNKEALHILQKDVFAADLYEHVLSEKKKTTPRSEFTREIIIL